MESGVVRCNDKHPASRIQGTAREPRIPLCSIRATLAYYAGFQVLFVAHYNERENNVFRVYLIFLLLLLSGGVNAAVATATGTISSILTYEGHGGPLIALSDMTPTTGFCSRNDYYILPSTHKYMAQNYALLLGAKMAGQKVSITVDSVDCFEGFSRIRHINLQ